MNRWLLIGILCFGGGGCMSGDTQSIDSGKATAVQLGSDFTMSGSSIEVKFAEVVEDSRCPKGTHCMWAGQARIKLTTATGKTGEIIVPGMKDEVSAKVTLEGIQIECLSLKPYPEAGKELKASDYTASLRLSPAP